MAREDRSGLRAVAGTSGGESGRNPPRLTPREGRKFGLTLGTAFLVLAAVLRWRGHDGLAVVGGVLGILMLFAGTALPGRLGGVHRAWMGLARAISTITTPVLLGLVYWVLVTPVGLIRRALGGNPLRRRERNGSYWVDRPPGTRSDLTRQF